MLTLSLSLSILLSQAAAVRRATPASDDPGMVVRQAGTVTVTGTLTTTAAAPDGGVIGYLRMPDGGSQTVHCTNCASTGWVPDGGSIGTVDITGDTMSSFNPDPSSYITGEVSKARFDSAGSLIVRSAVTTDEGSFSDAFAGAALETTLTGVMTFAASTAVTGVGTLFTTELTTQRYIKRTIDGTTAWVRIASIESDTALTLTEVYVGTPGAGATGEYSNWSTEEPGGASISVTGGSVVLTGSLVNTEEVSIWRTVDYGPLALSAQFSTSARVTEQSVYLGFAGTHDPYKQARFVFSGTSDTTVICRTSYHAGSINDVTATLPNAGTTATEHLYEVVVYGDRVVFTIDQVLVCMMQSALPGPYDPMIFDMRIRNDALLASSVTASLSWLNITNFNTLHSTVHNSVASRLQAQVQGVDKQGAPIVANPLVIAGNDGVGVKYFSVDNNGSPKVVGTITNNNSASAADNVPTLPAVASVAAPSYTAGRAVALSTDLSGALRVSMNALAFDAGWVSVANQYTSFDGGWVSVGNEPTVRQGVGEDGGKAWGVYVINQSGSSANVSGTLTNNGAAPTTDNLGVLPAIANAAAPSWTEGRQVLLSTDLTGALRVSSSASGPSTQGVGFDGGVEWSVMASGKASNGNSSTALLGIGAAFTGTWEEVVNYSVVNVAAYADVASAAAGFKFQWSTDGTNVDRTESVTLPAAAGRAFTLNTRARYFRVVYTNGGTGQATFRLGTVYHQSGTGANNYPLSNAVTTDSWGTVVKAVIAGETTGGGGAFVNVKVNPSGTLETNVSGTVSTRVEFDGGWVSVANQYTSFDGGWVSVGNQYTSFDGGWVSVGNRVDVSAYVGFDGGWVSVGNQYTSFDAGWVSVANIYRSVTVDGGTISVNNIERWGGQPMGTLVPVGFDGGWVSVGNQYTSFDGGWVSVGNQYTSFDGGWVSVGNQYTSFDGGWVSVAQSIPRTVASASDTGTCTTVGVASATVLASNASRKAYGFKASEANTVNVFCKLGATATTSNMPFGKGAAWSQDTGAVYTGVIDCISGSAAQTVCAYEFQ